MMLRKRTAILFLIIAYSTLLAHNIVPHHHHAHDHQSTVHHNANHHHDDDTDKDGKNLPFSHFAHSANVYSFTTAQNLTNTFCKQQFLIFALLPDNFLLDEFLIPPLLLKPPEEQLFYISPHTPHSGLRGPPALFI